MCNSIDKMQTEQIIDPFQIVRLIRASRQEFIDQVSFNRSRREILRLNDVFRINMRTYLCQ